jgi:uncharacterized membrane protein YkvA (DUF1232 family)
LPEHRDDDDAPPPARRPRARATPVTPPSGQVPATSDADAQEPLPGPHAVPALKPHGDGLTGSSAGESAEVALAGGSALAPLRLLAFYDRLRQRIAAAVERRGGRLGKPVADALLLVPDVFMLLVRLAFDREVPASTRTLIGGALAYFVLPFDLLPEAMMGPAGFVDDLVLAAAVLTQTMSGSLEARVRQHWSGSDDVRLVLQDIARTAHSLLGEDLFGRLRALLARRGVLLEGAGDGARLHEGDDDEEMAASGDVGRSPYH